MGLQQFRMLLGRLLKSDRRPDEDGEDVCKDPVCGMEVDPAQAAGQVTYRGRTYYFCSPACREQFDKDPHRFAYEPPRKRGCC